MKWMEYSPLSSLSSSWITSSGTYEQRSSRIAAGSKSSSSSVKIWSTNGLFRSGSLILFTSSAKRNANCHRSDLDAQCSSSCPNSLFIFGANESVIVHALTAIANTHTNIHTNTKQLNRTTSINVWLSPKSFVFDVYIHLCVPRTGIRFSTTQQQQNESKINNNLKSAGRFALV